MKFPTLTAFAVSGVNKRADGKENMKKITLLFITFLLALNIIVLPIIAYQLGYVLFGFVPSFDYKQQVYRDDVLVVPIQTIWMVIGSVALSVISLIFWLISLYSYIVDGKSWLLGSQKGTAEYKQGGWK